MLIGARFEGRIIKPANCRLDIDATVGGLGTRPTSSPGQWLLADIDTKQICPNLAPTKYDLVVNTKVPKALSLKIPRTILLQATKVIE